MRVCLALFCLTLAGKGGDFGDKSRLEDRVYLNGHAVTIANNAARQMASGADGAVNSNSTMSPSWCAHIFASYQPLSGHAWYAFNIKKSGSPLFDLQSEISFS